VRVYVCIRVCICVDVGMLRIDLRWVVGLLRLGLKRDCLLEMRVTCWVGGAGVG
jgi:hypothetical protein